MLAVFSRIPEKFFTTLSCLLAFSADTVILFASNNDLKNAALLVVIVLMVINTIRANIAIYRMYTPGYEDRPDVILAKEKFEYWEAFSKRTIHIIVSVLVIINLIRVLILRFAYTWIAIPCYIFTSFCMCVHNYNTYFPRQIKTEDAK